MTASSFGRSADSFAMSLARALRNAPILGHCRIVETNGLETGEQRIGIGDSAFEPIDDLKDKPNDRRRRVASVNQSSRPQCGSPRVSKPIRKALTRKQTRGK